MSMTMDSDIRSDLRNIINKLGHELSEIRRRSLDNICSKLRNGIIFPEDLIHHRDLFIHLMECMKTGDEIKTCLMLLADLTKFPAPCKTILELGGVGFFTSFRKDLKGDEDYIEFIDNVLDSLFHVHNDTSVYMSSSNATISTQSVTNVTPLYETVYDQSMSEEIFSKYETFKNSSTLYKTYSSSSTSGDIHHYNASSVLNHADNMTDVTNIQNRSFTCADHFQWISLTSGDRQILAVTDNRLQNSSLELLIQSCEFLRGVLFHDFPAEIFIQRPSVVKTLFAAVSIYKKQNIHVAKSVINCLVELCENLFKRLIQNQNKDIWQQEQMSDDMSSLSVSLNRAEGSSLSSYSTRHHRTSKQSNELSSFNDGKSAAIESDGLEGACITDALIQSQMSLTEFVLHVYNCHVELLQAYNEDRNLFALVVTLLTKAARILKYVNFKQRWDSTFKEDKKLIYTLMTVVHKFDPVVKIFTESAHSQEMELKAMLTCLLVTKLLNYTVPETRLYEVTTDSLVLFLEACIAKVSFMVSLPKLKLMLETILMHADEGFYTSFKEAEKLVISMESIDKFMKIVQRPISDISDSEVMAILQKMFVSLPIHSHSDVIKQAMLLCCGKYLKSTNNSSKWEFYMIRLLNNECEEVLVKSYDVCFSIIKESLSVSLVSEPLSTKYQQCLLLLQKNILHEIVTIGLFHPNEKISSMVKSILSTILISRLNMSANYWKHIVQNIVPYLPFIQSVLGNTDAAYEKSILSLIKNPQMILNAEGFVFGLSQVEQLGVSLRLMFLKISTMRSTGFALSLLYLTEHNKQQSRLVKYDQQEISYNDLFMFTSKDLIMCQKKTMNFAAVTNDDVVKLWDVFTDNFVEMNLRMSAAEQLAIILQDSTLSSYLKEKSIHTYIIEEIDALRLRVTNNIQEKKNEESYLLSLLRILKNVIQSQTSLCRILSLQTNLYLNCLQVSLLFSEILPVRYETACVLMYLLFSDVFKSSDDGKETKRLPAGIAKSYKLPVEFETFLPAFINCNMKIIQTLNDNQSIVFFLKVYCMINCDWFKSKQSRSNCSFRLQLPSDEEISIRSKLLPTIIEDITKNLNDSNGHFSLISNIGSYKLLTLLLHDGSETSNGPVEKVVTSFSEMCKAGAIKRILQTPPQTDDDFKLFVTVISLIEYSFVLATKQEVLQDVLFSESIVRMIESQSTTSNRSEPNDCRSVKQTILLCLISYYEYLKEHHPTNKIEYKTNISAMVIAIYNNLSRTGSESYYDLPLMEITLECLVRLLGQCEWSLDVTGGEGFCLQMLSWFIQILLSFHVDRMSAGVSFMGKGIVQKAVLCICHVVHELKLFKVDSLKLLDSLSTSNENFSQTSGASEALSQIPQTSQLPWLVPLLSDRSQLIRWSAWTISTSLISNEVTTPPVVNEFQNLPGGLWAASLGVILDGKECFFVRSQACKLLNCLMTYSTKSPIWNNMIVQDINSQAEITGIDAFLLLLDHFEFFGDLRTIFTNNFKLSLPEKHQHNASTSVMSSSCVMASVITDSVKSNHEEHISHDEHLQSSTNDQLITGCVLTTRSTDVNEYESLKFKCSILDLVSQLVKIAPRVVIKKLNEHQLFQLFLSSMSSKSVTDVLATLSSMKLSLSRQQLLHQQIKVVTTSLKFLRVLLRFDDTDDVAFQCDHVDVVNKLFSLFTLSKFTIDDSNLLNPVWNVLLDVLRYIWKKTNAEDEKNFYEIASCHLQDVCCCLYVFSSNKDTEILQKMLPLLLLLLRQATHSEDLKKQTLLYDFPSISKCNDGLMNTKLLQESSKIQCTSGTNLGKCFCHVLLNLYNKGFDFKIQRLVRFSLCCLFVTDSCLQQTACEVGFVVTLCEDLKDSLIKLNVLNFHDKKTVQQKRKYLYDDLVSILDLIRNFVWKNFTVKCQFINNQLFYHLHGVWLSSKLHQPLLRSLLCLFDVLSTSCKEGQMALCSSVNLSQKQTLNESAFLSYILTMVVNMHGEVLSVHGKANDCIHLCFGVITNCMSVMEGRNMLYKFNMFYHVGRIHSLLKTGNKVQRERSASLMMEWLKVLLALSYYTDGSRNIAKIKNFLQILIETIQDSNKRSSEYCVLILRNMIFVPSLKQVITSNQNIVGLMLNILQNSTSLKMKSIAMSFFWVMIYDYEKGKVSLKRLNVNNVLLKTKEEIHTGKYLSADGDLESYEKLKQYVSIVLDILKSDGCN